MKKIAIYIYIGCSALFFGLFSSCEQNSDMVLKPVQVQLYALYDSDKINLEDPFIRRIFYDPFVLNINVTNYFSLTQKDISGIHMVTTNNRYYVNFKLKKRMAPEFYRFTSHNPNCYIAVMVDGKVKTIARIDKPVQNGNFQLVARQSQTEQIRKFLQLFIL